MFTVIVARHGEVQNPNHVVYADLPGFDLSPTGVLEAHALGVHLSDRTIDIVLSSPLARARHTATAIARHHGLPVTIDDRLVETSMYPGWTGMRWEDVPVRYPEQFHGYLDNAADLDDVTESVVEIATRVGAAVQDAHRAGHSTVVVVGHQDPSQILRLSLLSRPLSELREDPPGHASATVLTSVNGKEFTELSSWQPETLQL